MNAMPSAGPTLLTQATTAPAKERVVKEQVVLVLQGGGALGAYQAGVYQALMEGGIEPDWVIGTSIGAINGALIAGNEPSQSHGEPARILGRRRPKEPARPVLADDGFGNSLANLWTVMSGIPGFFTPNPQRDFGANLAASVSSKASYYTTDPLKETLGRWSISIISTGKPVRLSVGAVNVRTSEMRYFDIRGMTLGPAHIMASGALPPAFPAVTIDGEPYWDGGIYSNTPIEVVLDDVPRRNSLIFSVNMWQPTGAASDNDPAGDGTPQGHPVRQPRQEPRRPAGADPSAAPRRARIDQAPPEERRADPMVQDLASYGCGTLMHLVRLLSPRLDGEDHTKDIDFTRAGIETRWKAGHDHARKVLAEKPWQGTVDMLAGVVIHEASE